MRVFAILLLAIAASSVAYAQELVPDTVVTMKARVVEVLDERTEPVHGMDISRTLQTIRAEVLDGPEEGAVITVDNDFLNLEEGDTFYLNHTTSAFDGTDYYNPVEKVRTGPLLVLALLFVAAVVVFGGRQGVRGLIALIASFVFIGFMLSGILKGYSPVLVSIGVASLIVLIGSYVTHGVNRTTSAAVVGMIATIAITGLLAFASIEMTDLSGWSSDEATYLNLNTRGAIDLAGLLLGGILIGLLGVLYDAAIGQAVSVEELARAGKHYTKREIYLRAVRIGREHVGALVNTLAIAYAGASLPLLLLFFSAGVPDIGLIVNREMFATEIVRILVGSIGLVLAVPITTAVAVWIVVVDGRGHGTVEAHGTHSHSR